MIRGANFLSDARALTARSVADDMIRWAAQLPVGFVKDDLELTVDIAAPDGDPAGCDVVIVNRGKPYRTRLRWAKLSRSTHYTLDCPVSGKAVRCLYAVDDRFGSQAALGLKYESRHGSRANQRENRYSRLSLALNGGEMRKAARGANRARLLSRLAELDPELLDEGDLAAVAKWRRTGVTRAVTTQAALVRGFDAYRMIDPAKILRRLAGAAPPPSLVSRTRSRLYLKSAYPTLTIAALVERPQDFNGSGWVMEFDPEFVVYAARTEGSEGDDLIIGWQAHPPGYQVVTLSKDNGDVQAVCPVTGTLTPALFFRHGRWASAKAQRLS